MSLSCSFYDHLLGRCQDGMVLILGRCQHGMVLKLGRCQDGLVLILGRCQDGLVLVPREMSWWFGFRKLGRCRGCVILLVLILSALDNSGDVSLIWVTREMQSPRET